MPNTATRPEQVQVTFRKVSFPFEETGFEPHWHGSPFISHFWSALSQSFGPGERFFIDALQIWKKQIEDPTLRSEIDEFCRQESHHMLQHRKFNRQVGEHGYDVEKMEARYRKILDRVRQKNDPMLMLSVTVALEHFTAGFADRYLSDPAVVEGADPNVTALWHWHAAEEAEHKSTAFDVFQAVGGTYFQRVSTLVPAWFLIISTTLLNAFEMLRFDGQPFDWRDRVRGIRYLFGVRGFVTSLIPSFFEFLSPRFHPWDHDNSELISEWESANRKWVVGTPTPTSD